MLAGIASNVPLYLAAALLAAAVPLLGLAAAGQASGLGAGGVVALTGFAGRA